MKKYAAAIMAAALVCLLSVQIGPVTGTPSAYPQNFHGIGFPRPICISEDSIAQIWEKW